METKTENKMVRVGGLWRNQTKDGKTYLSGTFGLSKIMVFPNDRKQKDTDPDYTLVIAEKPQDQNRPQQAASDDIPF